MSLQFVIKENIKGMTSLFPPIMPVLFSVLSDGCTPSRSAHSEPPQKPLHTPALPYTTLSPLHPGVNQSAGPTFSSGMSYD